MPAKPNRFVIVLDGPVAESPEYAERRLHAALHVIRQKTGMRCKALRKVETTNPTPTPITNSKGIAP